MERSAPGDSTVKKVIILALAFIFVVALASFMFTYTVRFTEAAVVTTFGEAREDGQVQPPGLHWKLPYPIQSVTKYDTRLRIVETTLETQQTRDAKQVILEGFAFYRVNDPMKFFRRFSNAGERSDDHFREAEDLLRSILRSSMGRIALYDMADLFPSEGGDGRLVDLERDILTTMRQGTEGDGSVQLSDYGVEVTQAGISKIVLPSATTQEVINRMRENRNRLVQAIESRGAAEAETIRARASADAERIVAFAEDRAAEIRAQGDIASAQFLAEMNEFPELAIFLKNIDMMRQSTAKRLTLITSTAFPGFELMDAGAFDGVRPGEMPASRLYQLGEGQEQSQLERSSGSSSDTEADAGTTDAASTESDTTSRELTDGR